ncbi:MAG: carbonic anhydrase family protein [Methylococcales bacterium]|nr:carbonic anhydrase family protein [Methylococcales bacterium]MBT7445778.1 carbonic anhydrase family protein [Methylococcales bacterium]
MGKLFLFALFYLLSATQLHAKDTVWGYQGEKSAEYWGSLKQDYVTCQVGKEQSPIDLEPPRNWFKPAKQANLPPLEFRYNASPLTIEHIGYTVEFTYEEENWVEFKKTRYDLVGFHLHTPSEHSERGREYDMEIHFVHKNKETGKHVVVALLVLQGPRNASLERILPFVPTKKDKTSTTPIRFNSWFLLPRYRDYFYYTGSLTTPPCTEGVAWFVMKYPIYVSRSQRSFIHSLLGNNARPKQPLNDREVLESAF